MRSIVLFFGVSIIYSIIRYVAFAPENAQNIPVFIVHKGVAMAAALCVAAGFLQQIRQVRGAAIEADPPDVVLRRHLRRDRARSGDP